MPPLPRGLAHSSPFVRRDPSLLRDENRFGESLKTGVKVYRIGLVSPPYGDWVKRVNPRCFHLASESIVEKTSKWEFYVIPSMDLHCSYELLEKNANFLFISIFPTAHRISLGEIKLREDSTFASGSALGNICSNLINEYCFSCTYSLLAIIALFYFMTINKPVRIELYPEANKTM